PRKGPLTQTTINRYLAILGAVLSWARKRRLLPRQGITPLTEIHREPDNNARIRFLSPDEYQRLLVAARASAWSQLRLLIVLAVTTGARKGTPRALRGRDMNLDTGRALIERTKNDTPHTLVLVPEVVTLLRECRGKPDDLVFASAPRPDRPFNWEKPYKLAL